MMCAVLDHGENCKNTLLKTPVGMCLCLCAFSSEKAYPSKGQEEEFRLCWVRTITIQKSIELSALSHCDSVDARGVGFGRKPLVFLKHLGEVGPPGVVVPL